MCVFALLPNGSQIRGKLQPCFLRPFVFCSEPLRKSLSACHDCYGLSFLKQWFKRLVGVEMSPSILGCSFSIL